MAERLGLPVHYDAADPWQTMKITINPTFSMETGELIAHDGQYEYSGQIQEFKGGTSQAQTNINTANGLQDKFATMGEQEQQQILPFLTNEMNNPQGFGEAGVNEMITAGGEATSGALGGATEEANLRASRIGNPSSSASIIDAASRNAGKQQSDNLLETHLANLKEKLSQQQAGEQGIAELSSGNIAESLSALGLSNEAVKNYIEAYKNTGGPLGGFSQAMGNLSSGLGSLGRMATGVAHGIKRK